MSIFHQYDIRGIYGEELDEKFAYNLGKAVVAYTKAKSIIIGYDSRFGNLKLFSAFAKSVTEQGVEVVHAGLISRPMLNYISWKHKYDLAVCISASHNPKEYNGFKFILRGKPFSYETGLNEVESLMKKDINYAKAKKPGKIISIDFIDEYVKFLSNNLSGDCKNYIKEKNLRIVADTSNGSVGEIMRRFLLVNGITNKLLFANPDGAFPCHDPNPLNPASTIILSENVKKFKADVGVILDPDADRIKFVDNNGDVVDNNYIDCLIVEDLLKKRKGATIVHDLIARKILTETIIKNHGKSVDSRVGSVNIGYIMFEKKAVYGCEVSGHRFFDNMNNLDSGMMSFVYLLNSLYSKERAGKKLSQLWKKYDIYPDLGEVNYKLAEGKDKQKVMDAIQKYYNDNKKKLNVISISNLDGVSIVTGMYWFNVRPSNTEPLLRLRAEGKDKKALEQLKIELEKFII